MRKNKPFWHGLWDSWRGKRLLLGTFYREFEKAKCHCHAGQAIYKVNSGYMVARDIAA